MSPPRIITRWIILATLFAILLVAASLRLHRLPELPLGLHYDEAANGILAGEIARGLRRPVFIASYTGKEVLFFYWTALWMRLFGVSAMALRLGSASIGVMTVAVSAWAVYELLRDHPDARWIATGTAALLAISFWHLVLSRYGFRAITQPLLQGLTVAALWRGLRRAEHDWPSSTVNGWLLLAGLFCGLTAYTYLAARAFPLPLAAALLTRIVAHRGRRRERLVQSGVVIGTAALVLAPLARYWFTHPGSFLIRAQQVAADNWSEVWSGMIACLRMLFVEGDPYVRFNLPGRPLFGPVVAGLFLLGLGIGLWHLNHLLRSSDAPHRPLSLAAWVFLLTSLPIMLLPSALATGEITPSNLRVVGLLPFIYVYPALGLWAIVALVRRLGSWRPPSIHFLFPIVYLLLLCVEGAKVAPTYLAWASSPALYDAADGDLVDIARYLNREDPLTSPSSTTTYVASRHYRHPTLAFLAEDYDAVRWLTAGRTLVFPSEGDALLLFPRSASEDVNWVRSMLPKETRLETPPAPDGAPAFYVYRAAMPEAPQPQQEQSVTFGQAVRLTGYTVTNQPRSGEEVEIAVWWKVTGTADQPDYRAVARLADPWGSIWGEKQPLHYPSEQWTEGELIVDHLAIPITPGAPPGDYTVRFGLYAPGADTRLPVLDDSGAYAGLYAELPVHVGRAKEPVAVGELDLDQHLDLSLDGLTLVGTRLGTRMARPGESLNLTLFWRAEETTRPRHQLSLQLGDRVLYQGDPVHGTYPFSEWERGELVADRYLSRLPLAMPPGEYPLTLCVEDQTTLDLSQITVEATDRTFDVPDIPNPLTVTLGHRVELLGYAISSEVVAPGETLALTLTWRALTEMRTDYTVFTHLKGPNGAMAGQRDRQPVRGSYPTSLWAEREVVTDVYGIPVSAAAMPGEHRLEVGMYVAETGTRLSIEKTTDNAIVLQTVSVSE